MALTRISSALAALPSRSVTLPKVVTAKKVTTPAPAPAPVAAPAKVLPASLGAPAANAVLFAPGQSPVTATPPTATSAPTTSGFVEHAPVPLAAAQAAAEPIRTLAFVGGSGSRLIDLLNGKLVHADASAISSAPAPAADPSAPAPAADPGAPAPAGTPTPAPPASPAAPVAAGQPWLLYAAVGLLAYALLGGG